MSTLELYKNLVRTVEYDPAGARGFAGFTVRRSAVSYVSLNCFIYLEGSLFGVRKVGTVKGGPEGETGAAHLEQLLDISFARGGCRSS